MYLTEEEHSYRSFYCSRCGFQIRARVDCGLRFCPVCSRRRALRIRSRISWLLSRVTLLKGQRIVMITLSTRNCADISEGIKHLIASFRRLRQTKSWKTRVTGGIYVVEITGRRRDWHPHLHIIAQAYYYPWQSLQRQWRKCSGGTAAFIQEIPTDTAVKYATKYVSKTNVPQSDHDELNSALANCRLFQPFGLWHAMKIPKRIIDAPCPQCGGTEWIPEVLLTRYSRAP